MALRYAFERVQISTYFYHYQIDDLVERYTTQPDFFFFRNRGRARVRGFEVESKTELGRGFALEVGGQIGRGILEDDDTNLDDITPNMFSWLLRKDFGTRAFAQIRNAFVAEDDRPGPSEVIAPGATLIDLAAGWSFTPNLELRGIVRNALDDSYYASPDPRWVYAPGRSASLTLAARF